MNPTRPISSTTAQFRRPGSDDWYCPARDINLLVPVLTRRALEQWGDGSLHAGIIKGLECTDEDAGKMAEALATFFSEETIRETDTVVQAFHVSGLDDVPINVRTVVLAMIAEELIGAFWWGIRDSIKVGQPIGEYDADQLQQLGLQLARYMRMPKWKRWLYQKWDKLKEALRRRIDGDTE
jgi:hypothetical protein